ncbi:hypothetical protein [Atlantibacter hermannii]|nr:hypothetical protein [Atlantibacter hermannii]
MGVSFFCIVEMIFVLFNYNATLEKLIGGVPLESTKIQEIIAVGAFYE